MRRPFRARCSLRRNPSPEGGQTVSPKPPSCRANAVHSNTCIRPSRTPYAASMRACCWRDARSRECCRSRLTARRGPRRTPRPCSMRRLARVRGESWKMHWHARCPPRPTTRCGSNCRWNARAALSPSDASGGSRIQPSLAAPPRRQPQPFLWWADRARRPRAPQPPRLRCRRRRWMCSAPPSPRYATRVAAGTATAHASTVCRVRR